MVHRAHLAEPGLMQAIELWNATAQSPVQSPVWSTLLDNWRGNVEQYRRVNLKALKIQHPRLPESDEENINNYQFVSKVPQSQPFPFYTLVDSCVSPVSCNMQGSNRS